MENIPAIFEDEIIGDAAKKLFDDAQHLLKSIIEHNWLTAKAVVGILKLTPFKMI
jgi:5-methyltetrahydrofolate--homocysteine methyltransferase